MKKRPFFSIPIATYNRAEEVSFALKRILAQSFKDFEVIICDDNSTDDTQKVIKQFKDKRVHYYRNSKNLGAVKNIGKVLRYVTGQYIFLHGDDDYLLYDNVLEKTYELIKKKNYGLIRLNYLYQTFDKTDVFDYMRNKFVNKDTHIHPSQKSGEIVDYIEKIDLYFITGIVFKNIYPRKISILDSELIPWFDVCYGAILKYGSYFQQNYSIIASWSQQSYHPGYYVKGGKLAWEEFYNAIGKVAGDRYYKKMLNRQLAISVNFLATIKFNSNNQNLLQYAKRIRQLNPANRFSARYWGFLLISLVLPKWVLSLVRMLYISNVKGKVVIQNYTNILHQVYAVRGISSNV